MSKQNVLSANSVNMASISCLFKVEDLVFSYGVFSLKSSRVQNLGHDHSNRIIVSHSSSQTDIQLIFTLKFKVLRLDI